MEPSPWRRPDVLSGVRWGGAQPIKPACDQATDELSGLEQGHHVWGRIALVASMAGELAADLFAIRGGLEHADLIPAEPAPVDAALGVVVDDLEHLEQLNPFGYWVGLPQDVHDLGNVWVGLGKLHVAGAGRWWWGWRLLSVHHGDGGKGPAAHLGRVR